MWTAVCGRRCLSWNRQKTPQSPPLADRCNQKPKQTKGVSVGALATCDRARAVPFPSMVLKRPRSLSQGFRLKQPPPHAATPAHQPEIQRVTWDLIQGDNTKLIDVWAMLDKVRFPNARCMGQP